MNNHDTGKEVLNGQQRHWEKMYTENIDMFGKEPSYPARWAAEMFAKSGVKKSWSLEAGRDGTRYSLPDTVFRSTHSTTVTKAWTPYRRRPMQSDSLLL